MDGNWIDNLRSCFLVRCQWPLEHRDSRRTVIRQTYLRWTVIVGEPSVRQTDITQTVVGKTTLGEPSFFCANDLSNTGTQLLQQKIAFKCMHAFLAFRKMQNPPQAWVHPSPFSPPSVLKQEGWNFAYKPKRACAACQLCLAQPRKTLISLH